jgi:hypothetical protein
MRCVELRAKIPTGTYELPFFAFGLERYPRQSTSGCILRLRPDVVAETARRGMEDIQRATIGWRVMVERNRLVLLRWYAGTV